MPSRLVCLKDKVVVITGGAGFLGSQYVSAILEANGIAVVLDTDADAIGILEGATKDLTPDNRLLCFCTDVADRTAVTDVFHEVVDSYGRVDALINNAAINPQVIGSSIDNVSDFESFSCQQWDAEIRVGLTGPFICSQIFGKHMAANQKGTIINISSDLGIIGPDQRLYETMDCDHSPKKPVSYSVVKTGILGLTRYLATYWGPSGVRVNALALGGVRRSQELDFVNKVSDRIPMGRMAEPHEYRGLITFMCSDLSSYINGATIVADGGRTVW